MFQFPNWSIELPGRSYPTGDPDGFSPKDEVLRFIEGYCAWIKAPVQRGVNVSAVRAQSYAGRYEIISDMGPVAARNVVIATGPYQRPRLPTCHRALPAGVVQVHAADYRNPTALPDGAVLVVGSGASGCQIADELLESGRRVYLSIGQHRRVPRRYRNAARITSVIWATGYEFDFGWVQLPVFDSRGAPAQYRGATALPGLYFLGLPWMHKPKSSFLYGAGEDAAYIASRIADGRRQSAVRQ